MRLSLEGFRAIHETPSVVARSSNVLRLLELDSMTARINKKVEKQIDLLFLLDNSKHYTVRQIREIGGYAISTNMGYIEDLKKVGLLTLIPSQRKGKANTHRHATEVKNCSKEAVAEFRAYKIAAEYNNMKLARKHVTNYLNLIKQ